MCVRSGTECVNSSLHVFLRREDRTVAGIRGRELQERSRAGIPRKYRRSEGKQGQEGEARGAFGCRCCSGKSEFGSDVGNVMRCDVADGCGARR